MQKENWALVHSFLAVARAGSLSAAAAETGISQPTLGRHIDRLEDVLGLRLFLRGASGLVLTDHGAALLESAEGMAQSAARFFRRGSGMAERIGGTVRVTTSEVVACEILGPVLAESRRRFPGIELEVEATNETKNLTSREADIAVRMYRPRQFDIVARRIGAASMGFFAHEDYIARRGMPASPVDLGGHDLIGFDRDELYLRVAREMGLRISRDDFALRTDSQMTQLALLRAGAGIGVIMKALRREGDGLVAVLPALPVPPLEFWIAYHQDQRNSAPLRAIAGLLAEMLGPYCDLS